MSEQNNSNNRGDIEMSVNNVQDLLNDLPEYPNIYEPLNEKLEQIKSYNSEGSLSEYTTTGEGRQSEISSELSNSSLLNQGTGGIASNLPYSDLENTNSSGDSLIRTLNLIKDNSDSDLIPDHTIDRNINSNLISDNTINRNIDNNYPEEQINNNVDILLNNINDYNLTFLKPINKLETDKLETDKLENDNKKDNVNDITKMNLTELFNNIINFIFNFNEEYNNIKVKLSEKYFKTDTYKNSILLHINTCYDFLNKNNNILYAGIIMIFVAILLYILF